MKKGKLFVISGPSGSGKSTIRSRIIGECDNIFYSVSMTTRSPREGEIDGIDYYFVTEREFKDRIKQDLFLEYAHVFNANYYGTPKDKVLEKLERGINVILEIDVEGALNVKKIMPEAILVFITPPSMEVLAERMIKRNTDELDKLLNRFKVAYNELKCMDKYDYIIENDDLDKAIDDFKMIVEGNVIKNVNKIKIDLGNKEEIINKYFKYQK